MNSLKRMLDVLRPRVESQFKSWGSCFPNTGNTAPGERLSEVTVMLRAKFRNYLQAIVEKLAENVSIIPKVKKKKKVLNCVNIFKFYMPKTIVNSYAFSTYVCCGARYLILILIASFVVSLICIYMLI